MAVNGAGKRSSEQSFGERQVDVRRYLGALRRNAWLIAAIVVVVTAGVLVISLLLPKNYTATATIVYDAESTPFVSTDAESTQRRLATFDAVLNGAEVQQEAAREVPGESADSISNMVQSSVDDQANLISVSATARDPELSADVANAVANTFLRVRRELEEERLAVAREDLLAEIDRLESGPQSTPQIAAIRDRLSELGVQGAQAGADLQLAEAAEPPSAPASPRPLRNTVLAFFAGLFLGIVVALGRDQLRPQISDPRELSRLLGGVPVLAGIPYVRRGLRRRRRQVTSAIEHEGYQTLRAALQLALPPTEQRVIVVSSAVHAEGKTTVVARLGRALAATGHDTLLVSADLRWPNLHELFSVPVSPGLSDVLGLIERAGVSPQLLPATVHQLRTGPGADGREAKLDVLASGSKPSNPAAVLSGSTFGAFIEHVRTFSYRYVLVDGPPMLGIADMQPLLRQAGGSLLLVSRLDRLNVENTIDIEELLGRLGVRPVGLVVIGARADVSPYYLGERPPVIKVESDPTLRTPQA